MSLLAFLLHLTSSYFMIKGYNYNSMVLPQFEWIASSKCGLWQFLTIQSLIASIITMGLGLFGDLTSSQTIRSIQRQLLTITLPVSWAVTIIYWSLMFIAPALLYSPPLTDTGPDPSVRIPLAQDLLLHVLPALSLSLEFLVFQRPYSKRTLASSAVLTHIIAGFYYSSVVEYCAAMDGKFPYPFLAMSPLYTRILIYMGGTSISTLSLWLINGIHPNKGREIPYE